MGSGRRNLGQTWECASCSSDRAGNETPHSDQYAETPAKQKHTKIQIWFELVIVIKQNYILYIYTYIYVYTCIYIKTIYSLIY